MPKPITILSDESKEAALAASLTFELKRTYLASKFKHKTSTITIDGKKHTITIELEGVNIRHLLFEVKDARLIKSIVTRVVKRAPQLEAVTVVRDTVTVHLKY